jgi:hypothetical protein
LIHVDRCSHIGLCNASLVIVPLFAEFQFHQVFLAVRFLSSLYFLPARSTFVMITRDPDAFLRPLYQALDRRRQANLKLLPAVLSFHAAKYAVALRMRAIDDLAVKFEEFVNQPNRAAELTERLPAENQLLFDFFANGLSALESFCFGSYYVGVGLVDDSKFNIKKRWSINPEKVLASFQAFEPAERFTLALSACLKSPERKLIKAMRNTLLHSVTPGRSIRVLCPDAPHVIDLDQWYKGDWSRAWGGTILKEQGPLLKFFLEPNALIKQRDWIDGQLELLSSSLCDLAAKHGLK